MLCQILNIILALTLTASPNAKRGAETLDAIYRNYTAAPDTCLLREYYPHANDIAASYIASQEQQVKGNPYSYLWPYSGTFSAVNALLSSTGDPAWQALLNQKVRPGLERYFDCERFPTAYASYMPGKQRFDRYYDDNVWIGIDLTDHFMLTGDTLSLKRAREVWQFIASGMDDRLGGGIYWCEQKRESKNTCSNAPGAVFALKLFIATNDSIYLNHGVNLYRWTKTHLQDGDDNLYFDHISLNGKIDRRKFSYNSGQMMQAAALLYRVTGKKKYLSDAKKLAKACHEKFFFATCDTDGTQFRLVKKGNVWFMAVMLRGYIELYGIDGNPTYLSDFRRSLDHAWRNARDTRGLFHRDWSGKEQDDRKWVLTQAAFAEMYGRIAAFDNLLTENK